MAADSKGALNFLWGRIKAIPRELVGAVTDKIIPQGAAEIAQAINTGNGYVAYGPRAYASLFSGI